MSKIIVIDHQKCVGCGMCTRDCPVQAIKLIDSKANMLAENCMECGHCVAICPQGAVSMNGYDMTQVKPYDKDNFSISSDQLLNAIKFRRTIRQYRNKDVEKEKLEKIIEAGRYTPTGSNKQNIRYVVISHPENNIEKDGLKTFAKIMKPAGVLEKVVKLPIEVSKYKLEEGFFFHKAPIVIFVISTDAVNASLASENMELMAESLGLGVLFGGLFVRAAKMSKKIRNELGMTGKEKLITAMAIGYPAVKYQRTVVRKEAKVDWRIS